MNTIWRYLQSLYYLRFSLLLLIALPLMAFVDSGHEPSAILHGVLTPEFFGQWFGCAFFATCNAAVALLLARTVCINGGAASVSPTEGFPN